MKNIVSDSVTSVLTDSQGTRWGEDLLCTTVELLCGILENKIRLHIN